MNIIRIGGNLRRAVMRGRMLTFRIAQRIYAAIKTAGKVNCFGERGSVREFSAEGVSFIYGLNLGHIYLGDAYGGKFAR